MSSGHVLPNSDLNLLEFKIFPWTVTHVAIRIWISVEQICQFILIPSCGLLVFVANVWINRISIRPQIVREQDPLSVRTYTIRNSLNLFIHATDCNCLNLARKQLLAGSVNMHMTYERRLCVCKAQLIYFSNLKPALVVLITQL